MNPVISKLIGKFIYDNFVFLKYLQAEELDHITNYDDFLHKYKNALKSDVYKVIYNEYYEEYEESIKNKKVGKKK